MRENERNRRITGLQTGQETHRTSGRHRKVMKERLAHALICLANDIPLDYSYHDHALIGNRLGYRECHLSFDLVLIYKLIDDDILLLDKLGSHTEALGL